MARTVVSPSMQKVASLDAFAKAATQSAAPPAKAAPMKADATTFKPGPEIQTFRFKKNSRGHGGERE